MQAFRVLSLAALAVLPTVSAAAEGPEISHGVSAGRELVAANSLAMYGATPRYADSALHVWGVGSGQGVGRVAACADGTAEGPAAVTLAPPDSTPSEAILLALDDDTGEMHLLTHSTLAPNAYALWRVQCDGTSDGHVGFSIADPNAAPLSELAHIRGGRLRYRAAGGLAEVDVTADDQPVDLVVPFDALAIVRCVTPPEGLICTFISTAGLSILRLDGDGTAHRLLEPRFVGPVSGGPVLYDAARGLVHFPSFSQVRRGEVRATFGVLRLSDMAFGEMPLRRDWEWSINDGFEGATGPFVVGTDRALAVHVAPLIYDESQVDLDNDTLEAAREAALGTSDWAADSDGDGVDDPIEQWLFETSPQDAGSHPPPSHHAWRWGPSTRVDLERRTLQRRTPTNFVGTSVACDLSPGGDYDQCVAVGEDGVEAEVRVADPSGIFTPDAGTQFIPHAGRDPRFLDGFTRADRQGTTTGFFPLDVPELSQGKLNGILAVSEDTLYLLASLGGQLPRLFRVTAAGAEELEPAFGCPLAAVGTADCVERYSPGAISGLALLGTDSQRAAAYVRVDTAYSSYLALLDGAGVRPLQDLGVREVSVRSLANNPRASELLVADPDGRGLGRRLGQDFTGERFLALGGPGPLGVTARGYSDVATLLWLIDDPAGASGGCVSVGSITLCDIQPSGGSGGPVRNREDMSLEWLPMEAPLEAGEVLLAGFADGYDAENGEIHPGHWAIFKMARNGAVSEFLDEATLVGVLADPTLREELARQPLDHVDALAVSPRRDRLCFTEHLHQRAFEVTLDPERGVPTGFAKLSPPGSDRPRACAYDTDGRVAVADAQSVFVGDERLNHPVGGAVTGLLRAGDRWVLWGAPAPAACVSDDGTVTQGGQVIAVADLPFAPGHLAYLVPGRKSEPGQASVGGVLTLDGFCHAAPPIERLEGPTDYKLYDILQQARLRVTARRSNVDHASFVARPDGEFVLAFWDRTDGSGNPATELWGPELTYVFEAGLSPADPSGAHRLPALDPWRREAMRHSIVLGPRANPPERRFDAPDHKPGAVALVPGATVEGDWGHHRASVAYTPEGGWPAVVAEGDAGDDAGVGGRDGGGKEGGGCAIGPSTRADGRWVCWGAVVVWGLGRRRRRR